MSDSEPGQVSDATHAAEEVEEQQHGRSAGRPPTPEEEAAADRSADSAKGVEEPYREMTEKGAHVKGEGAVEG